MKKNILFILILISTSCHAAPKIIFDTQIHNFGTVKQNVPVTHTFSFKNSGKDPLHIIRISPSWGVSSNLPGGKIIPSGGNGKIEVTFNGKCNTGKISKTITITTNDPDNPTLILLITADYIN